MIGQNANHAYAKERRHNDVARPVNFIGKAADELLEFERLLI